MGILLIETATQTSNVTFGALAGAGILVFCFFLGVTFLFHGWPNIVIKKEMKSDKK